MARRNTSSDAAAELIVGLVLTAVLAPIIALFDEPVLGQNLPLWMCALIALVLSFGGVLIITRSEGSGGGSWLD